ncbi:MAG: NAD(+) synthase, partial [Nitratireductor sp.]
MNDMNISFSIDDLKIDPAAETQRIVTALRTQLRSRLRKRGLVLGLS